jgi:hypothetical protein
VVGEALVRVVTVGEAMVDTATREIQKMVGARRPSHQQ